MRRVTRTMGTTVVALLTLVSFAPITFAASEVEGTLSSDGSSGAANEIGDAGGTTTASQSLTGMVVGGTENSAQSALAGLLGSQNALILMSILIPLTLLIAGAGFLTYRRRSI